MIGLKERLLQFIAFHMMSVRAFEASCGFKNAPPQKAVDIVLWPFSYQKGERFGEKAKAGR